MTASATRAVLDQRQATPRPRRVLVASDFSPASAAAGRAAIELAGRERAELLILTVIDPGQLRLPGGRFRARIDQVRATREAAAGMLVARAGAAGVQASYLVWQGDPAESIIEAAASEAVDLIIVGARARDRLGRMLFGSVSRRVRRDALVPVLVVPAERHEGGA